MIGTMPRRQVKVGGVTLGDGHVAVQSMATVKTSDVERCVAQIVRLERAGCEIIRVSVLDEADARAITRIRENVSVPVVADIHFSARLACLAVEAGADKIRVNPGNIGGEDAVARVASCVKTHHIPIRVGANSGSLERESFSRYGRSAEALVESALKNAAAFERYGVSDLVLSVKSSDVRITAEAYRALAARTEYPLHLGVTEAGGGMSGLIKSSIGIGALLLDGIGDTIRVSLTADPEEEVVAAREILRAVGLDRDYVEVVSCPTCGRCEYDCMGLAARVRERVKGIRTPLKVAVMGCVVNGPGEAEDADLGIAGGKAYCILFERGKEPVRVAADDAERAFLSRLEVLLGERSFSDKVIE